MKDNMEFLKKNMASCLAKYFGWREADLRDNRRKMIQRFADEGWVWSDDELCWQKTNSVEK